MKPTKEMIEALRKSLNGVAYISTVEAADAITAALAAMPGPVVKAEYANRSTGGFTPATDLQAENDRLREALEEAMTPEEFRNAQFMGGVGDEEWD